MRKIIIVSTIFIGALILAGCSSPTSNSSPTAQTFGARSQSGQSVFTNQCSRCHGANGQGVSAPAIIGANAGLSKYTTATGLLEFISSSMPLSNPGSLSHQEYLDVLSYLLVQNNYVSPATVFDDNALKNLALK